MLHCFGCGKDLPDNLAYCLYCGAKLDDDEETVVHPTPVPGPYVDPTPKPGSGVAKFILGSLLGGFLVILLLVVGAFVLYSLTKDDKPTVNTQVNNAVATASPSPSKSPSPRKPTPSPTSSNVTDNSEVIKHERECRIVNPQGGTVNLRRNCDTRDCSMDASTLYTQGDPGDTVVPTGRATVTTGKFTWVQVRYHGETLWISSTRMSCE